MKFEGVRVLVTGGAGFIGSHLVDKLVGLGSLVTVVDNLSLGFIENVNSKAMFKKLDVCNYARLKEVIAESMPQMIFHLAANPTTKESAMGWNNPFADHEVNMIGTLNVLEAIVNLDIDATLIYTSSAAVYGEPEYVPMDEKHPTNPVSPYGVSKLAGEKYALAYYKERGIRTTILRIFNTYGPRQPRYVMFDLIKKLNDNPEELELLGTGEQIRDYCYISDTVGAFILAAERDASGGVFNIGADDPISIKSLAETIIRILGLEDKVKVRYTGKTWSGDITRLVADISQAKGELGFKRSVFLEEGLRRLIRWYEDKNKDTA
ncbi:NAD-dependent epimerase/dehydratase family protein [Chloroflexota bacterium]